MFTALGAFLKTVTGRVALGVVVSMTAVGTAAAADAPIPVIDDFISGDESSVEAQPEMADEDGPAPAVDERASEDEESPDGEAADESADGDDTDGIDEDPGEDIDGADEDPAAESEGSEEDGSDTHGSVVSEFARSTELEGCERGQAVAGVARGDLVPGSDTFDDDLATLVADRCNDDDDVDAVDEDPEGEPDANENMGRGRPDHAPGPPPWAGPGGGQPGRSGSAPGRNR